MIIIEIATQKLILKNDNTIIATYPISSATKGLGEKKNSFQTPRGKHIIWEKIGADLPIFSVFRARKPTGEIFSEDLAKQFPNRDWILSRILWLSGMEAGFNSGGDVDTKERFIYIHGTNDEKNIGVPHSHGCIRMRNQDVIELFERVQVGELVRII
jgi:lipoprotein-anchoring transpeptidase ErfK/SrfK